MKSAPLPPNNATVLMSFSFPITAETIFKDKLSFKYLIKSLILRGVSNLPILPNPDVLSRLCSNNTFISFKLSNFAK